METTWAVETHGNPLGWVTTLVESIWQEAGLDGLFVSGDTLEEQSAPYYLVEQAAQLQHFNPFRPAMHFNSAHFVPGMLREHPVGRFGVLLRPCEIRALHQLESLDPFARERLITICVDCLGTFAAEDVEWRTERKGSADRLAEDTLKYARQGGISVDRYRPACQVCCTPSAEGANFNIWVIGLPARQYILLNIPAEGDVDWFHPAGFQHIDADPDMIAMRQRVLERVNTRNHLTRERIVHEVVNLLPANIEAIAAELEACGDCRKCLDACPICSAMHVERGEDGHYSRHQIARWLARCAGCGMCEQACTKGIPLSAVFGAVHDQMRAIQV
jgi:formate dehydrogenase subunit beta